MMTKEGSTKIVNFMTSGAGVHVLWRGHKSHKVKKGGWMVDKLPIRFSLLPFGNEKIPYIQLLKDLIIYIELFILRR